MNLTKLTSVGTIADVPAGTKTRYKNVLNHFLNEHASTVPSPAAATTLGSGSARKPVLPVQDKGSKSRADRQVQQPMQDLHDREKAGVAYPAPQQGVNNKRGSSTSGVSPVSQKRKRAVGQDEATTSSPEKKSRIS